VLSNVNYKVSSFTFGEMVSTLYMTNMLSWIFFFIVQAHLSNSPCHR